MQEGPEGPTHHTKNRSQGADVTDENNNNTPSNEDTNNEQKDSTTLADLQAQVAKLTSALEDKQNVLDSLAEENKKRRHKASEAKKQAEQAMAENGEFKALAESLQARVGEYEQKIPELIQKAEAYDMDAKQRTAALEAKVANLSEVDRELVMAGATLAARERLAERFMSSTPTSSVNQEASTGSNKSNPQQVDTSDGEALMELKRTDPEAYRAAITNMGRSSTKGGTLAKLFGR